jgi:hypothetical protein
LILISKYLLELHALNCGIRVRYKQGLRAEFRSGSRKTVVRCPQCLNVTFPEIDWRMNFVIKYD